MPARQEFPSTVDEVLFAVASQRIDHVHLGGSTLRTLVGLTQTMNIYV
jgi:hypothetical protein